MKAKHQRLVFVAFSVVFLCIATLLTMRAFSENLVFFYSPGDLASNSVAPTQLIRIGGLVKAGSITQSENDGMHFIIEDGKGTTDVFYKGMIPILFREKQGVIAEGYIENHKLRAIRILSKHDEKYMPREIVDALKKNGQWKEGAP